MHTRRSPRLEACCVLSLVALAACGQGSATDAALDARRDGAAPDAPRDASAFDVVAPDAVGLDVVTPDATGLDARAMDAVTPSDVAQDHATTPDASVPVAVLTNRNDNARTGTNLAETQLTTHTVAPATFGLLFSRTVDGQQYAQPLYVPALSVGGRTRNVVYAATEHNSVYAFDADDPTATAPLWTRNLGPSVPNTDISAGCVDMAPEYGITATPVVDTARGVLYVIAVTKESGAWFQRLHALDLRTGAEALGGPTLIAPSVPGTGAGSRGGMVGFDALHEHPRPGLLLANGMVYAAFASHCDTGPYHGWVLAYDAATLHLVAAYNDTPNGSEGGIWQSGEGLSVDETGSVYFASGNGSFDMTGTNPALGISAARLTLSGSTLSVADWYTPFNASTLDPADEDFGVTGVTLVPGTHLALVGSKEGNLYVLDRTHLGNFNASGDMALQRFLVADSGGHHVHGAPLVWTGPMGTWLYVWPEVSHLHAYALTSGRFGTTPVSTSSFAAPGGMPGGIMALSAHGAAHGTGIVWAALPTAMDANHATVPGTLRAFDAEDVSHELWNSGMSAGDALGNFAKFTPPTVANGRVYMATFSNALRVYGLR